MQTIGAKIQLDGEAQFKAGLQNITQQSKTLAAEMKALKSSFDQNATAQDKARAKMQVLDKQISTQNTYIDKLNKQYSDQKKKLDEIGAEYEKVAAEQGENSAAAQKLADAYIRQDTALSNTQEKINKATTALNKMQSEMRECEAAAKGLSLSEKFKEAGGKVKEAGDKVSEFGDKLSNVGKTASVVTGAVVAVGKKAVDAFKEVDAGADTIVTKTGASGKALEEMQSSMENLATTIPTSFEAAGEAIGEVNTRFGVTGDELETLSGQFVKFAEINGVDITNAVDSAQKAMAAFNVDTKDAGGFLDLLTVQAQRTGISTDALTQSMVTNGPALKEMGMSADTAAVFLADLEVSGTDASAVMTGLKKALTNAAKEGKPLSDAMKEIQDKIKNAKTETDGINAASELFGNKAGPAMYRAVKEGQISFEDLASSTNDFSESLGAVDDTFQNTLDPIDQLKTTTNGLKTGLADLANTVMTALGPSLSSFTETIKSLVEKFRELSPETQMMIVKIAAIAAAIGPALIVVGKIVSGIGSIISIGGTLMTVLAGFNPVVLGIVAVCAALVAAGVLVYKNWDKIKEVGMLVIDYLKAKWDEFRNAFNNVAEAVKAKTDEWKKKFQDFKQAVSSIIDSIKTKFNNLKDGISTAIENVKTKIQSFADKVREIKDTIFGYIEKIKSFFSNLILKIPKPSLPSLPHFEVTWTTKSFLGQDISIPHVGINWYDKGGIFSHPSIIGVGEKRPEFVGALDDLRKIVREESGDTTVNIIVNGAEGQDVRELANIVMDKINTQMRRESGAFA